MTEARYALDGIRVLELGNFMAGPFCGMLLGDLGADVIKVENPKGGDFTRNAAPFLDGESAGFLAVNRNKRSIAIDLKADRGREIFLELVRRSDVVIENLRPGTLDDLRLLDRRLAGVIVGRAIYMGRFTLAEALAAARAA